MITTLIIILLTIITHYIFYNKYKQKLIEDNKLFFDIWKQDFKTKEIPKIKKETLKKSKSIVRGLATEHLAPFMQNDLNPEDFRHIGNPIDYIVFDGLSSVLDGETDELKGIVFLDIKTNTSKLNKVQRRIKTCILEKKVSFQIYNPDKEWNHGVINENRTKRRRRGKCWN